MASKGQKLQLTKRPQFRNLWPSFDNSLRCQKSKTPLNSTGWNNITRILLISGSLVRVQQAEPIKSSAYPFSPNPTKSQCGHFAGITTSLFASTTPNRASNHRVRTLDWRPRSVVRAPPPSSAWSFVLNDDRADLADLRSSRRPHANAGRTYASDRVRGPSAILPAPAPCA